MIFFTLLILLLLERTAFQPIKVVDKNPIWCSLNNGCQGGEPQHLACKYNGNCTLNPPCTLGNLDRSFILGMHNAYRNRFALGKRSGPMGVTAADMSVLNWDEDLAFTAACNLKMCEEHMEHDFCHHTRKYKTSGQNLGESMYSKNCLASAYRMMKGWYNEIDLLTEDNIIASGKAYTSHEPTGHFTQFVWSRTTHVGCALAVRELPRKGFYGCIVACNYGPSGNVLGAKMFKAGKTCSMCRNKLLCNSKYTGLCGEVYGLKKKGSRKGKKGRGNISGSCQTNFTIFFNVVGLIFIKFL